MPTKGTDGRRVRGISGDLWERFRAACVGLHGTDNRSEVIRKFVEETVEEFERDGQTP